MSATPSRLGHSRAFAILDAQRVPRTLHPIAWWIWALGLAVAVSRTTNPLLLLLAVAVLGFVVSNRRGRAPWARAFKYYLMLAVFVIVLRIVFRTIFGTGVTPDRPHPVHAAAPPDPVLVRRHLARRPGLARGDAVGRGRWAAAGSRDLLHRCRERARKSQAGATGPARRAVRARDGRRRRDQHRAAADRERAAGGQGETAARRSE